MTQALDLAALPASPQQRRAAVIAIASLTSIALIAAPFSRVPLGTFPGFVTLYGGAALIGLAITATIVFAQFALSRRASLLALACGAGFAAIVFVPYIVLFPAPGAPPLFGAPADASSYLWIAWHTVFAASFLAYAVLSRRFAEHALSPAQTAGAILTTAACAYGFVHIVLSGHGLPRLLIDGEYSLPLYLTLALVTLLCGAALMLLQRCPEPTVIDRWLMVPAAALIVESLLNALAGRLFSVGWYLSRLDVLVATTFLVVVLLLETNRLARVLSVSEGRLRGIVNGVTDALIVVDGRSAVAAVNPAGAALFGFVAEDLTGTPISRLLPEFDAIARTAEGRVVETTGRDARDGVFPIELARGRDSSRRPGETILIVRDITQRKHAEEAVRAAHDRAIEAAEVKSQFLATMSHEIRTPINAVVGMSELLLQTPLSEEGREYANIVRDSAESLLAIVNDILDFSKIEAGRLELEAVPFAPVVAVENATDILAAAARKKGLSLATYVAPDVPRRVAGDADRLRQVLLNLLGNAVKFTHAGSVTVRAVVDRSEGDTVVLRFSVTDTGPGIAADVAERLFEPFTQADQTTRRRYGGTGLGLSISRRIVELMGGRIGFDSIVGRGSTFWFTVPFPRAAEAEDASADRLHGMRILVVDEDPVTRQVIDEYLLSWGASPSSTGSGSHALELARALAARGGRFDAIVIERRAGGDAFALAARLRSLFAPSRVAAVVVSGGDESAFDARAAGFDGVVRKPIRQQILHDALVAAIETVGALAPSPPAVKDELVDATAVTTDRREREAVRVLVAEDNPVNRKLALQQLKKLGYSARAVADGREAIEAVSGGHYDLVLMDCQMPEVDGFAATREIRRAEVERGVHVPIVAMTANALEGDREACLAAGMDDYLAKPVQLASLRAVVERFASGVGVAG
ncbi:MAG: response regulator [Candidatus Eremiobacteraeota bacterium]|nr:response regulator [Candidatus Eremiobacteraeota bacterium]